MTSPARSDLASLFTQPGGTESFRQGVILAFNSSTGANQVQVGGAVLENLPILVGGDTVNFGPGDVVILLKFRSSWAILGRIVVPGNENLTATAVDFYSNATFGATPFNITTSFSTAASVTITTPAWANSLLLYATSLVNVTNPTAGTDFLRLITDINGNGGGESIHGVDPGKFAAVAAPVARELRKTYPSPFTLSGSTQVDVRVRSNTGAWSAGGNAAFLNVIGIFRRI